MKYNKAELKGDIISIILYIVLFLVGAAAVGYFIYTLTN